MGKKRVSKEATRTEVRYGVLFPDGYVQWADNDGLFKGQVDIRTVDGQKRVTRDREEHLKYNHAQSGPLEFIRQTVTTSYSDFEEFEAVQ